MHGIFLIIWFYACKLNISQLPLLILALEVKYFSVISLIFCQVQNLIERCLQLYMSRRDVVSMLQQQAKIEPGFTELGIFIFLLGE